jgi:hypothetical protein
LVAPPPAHLPMSTGRQSVGIKKQAEELEERTSLILSLKVKSELLDVDLSGGGAQPIS